MKHIIHIFLAIVLAVSLAACSGTDEVALTADGAMSRFKELSPREGAEFYMANRGEFTFLDTLYRDSVMPAVMQCNYFDLDSVYRALGVASLKAEIEPVRNVRRDSLIGQVKVELGQNTLRQMDVYTKYYLPSLEMSIDSMLDEDVGKIMSKYAGGFMNFRKLAFLFGRDRNDFKEMFWDKFDTLRYQNKIAEYVHTFYNSVKEEQDSYCKDMTGQDFDCEMKITVPYFTIGLSQSTLSHVKKYTSKQADEMINEAIKDYAVPIVLGAVSGGLSNIYDVGSAAYDVNEIIKDMKSTKIDDDEMVKYICAHDLAYQIRNYYIDKWTSQVMDELKRSNGELYHFIQKNL